MMSSTTEKISNFAFLHIKRDKNKRMTQLCISAIESEIIVSGNAKRVDNKTINLCFNPSGGEQSGSSSFLTEEHKPFSPSDVDYIRKFFESIDGPICFVAHYGFGYDYAILKEELNRIERKFDMEIFCVDTTQFFRNHVNGKISSIWPLRDIYTELTSSYPYFSNTAEGYVDCLIYCVSRYADDFVTWANNDATPFSTPEVNI
ncbi:hypothetical protein WA026_018492 [Henosepilachna vigintioctopunctata]|uniref:Uncharacterized protein n=1 Tax=Henosepilachna vigintioctopunctata TaxID=420089 RepID=A0AAW1UTJ5_9CUCU